MKALLERTRTRSSPPRRTPPWTPCALRRRCATPAATRRSRTSLLALRDAGRLQQRTDRASPRCPPKDAWRQARGRRCGWGVLQRLYISCVTTCRRTTAREGNPWPRYKPSNTPLNTSTSFQTSWVVRNGRKTDHFYASGLLSSGHLMEIVLYFWWVMQHINVNLMGQFHFIFFPLSFLPFSLCKYCLAGTWQLFCIWGCLWWNYQYVEEFSVSWDVCLDWDVIQLYWWKNSPIVFKIRFRETTRTCW